MHRPEIIFLDEPSIGLDVVAKKALRDLLLRISREEGVTLFLTSHDVGDIEFLCERTIVINHGSVMKDLPTRDIVKSFALEKQIDLFSRDGFIDFPELPAGLRYVFRSAEKITVSADTRLRSVGEALRGLIEIFEISDIDVYDIDLETIIRHMYDGNAL
jgi:ABC-2 type transport system ATP-binding protein